ncbi:MAG TPA: AMP-binding protein [Mycobacteriales bacterium]|nr:AMP-binding protein [Mycobacteriales bacterium]
MATPFAPPGLPRSLNYPQVSPATILLGAARRWPDRAGWIDGWGTDSPDGQPGRSMTFADCAVRAAQFAHALRSRGIGRGDVVAVHAPNCLDYPAVYYGILLAGATFSPTNPLLPPDDLAFQLGDCAAKAVVTWGIAAPAVAGVRDRIPAELVIGIGVEAAGTAEHVDVPLDTFLAGQPTDPPAVEVDVFADLAHLAYTGGTTGRSKGVELPYRNVVVNTLQYACWGTGSVPALDEAGNLVLDQIGSAGEWPLRLGTGVSVHLTPWFHAMGTIGGLNLTTLTGSTLVIHLRFDPGRYLEDAERYRVTGMGGAPPIYVALLQHPDIDRRDLSSVRGISSGAAPLPVEVLDELNRRFPNAVVGEGYGLTEVTMGATSNPSWRSAVRKVGSVGVPVFDTEIKLADGEVCIRGPQVMRGYHNRPDATAEVLDADGWLRTGDIGALDDDGYLTIVDRKKDMLIYKGYNVYPRELEEVLFTHPAVVNAAVVGKRDLATGELPVAFVVLTGDADPADVMSWVNERVTPYKKLRDIRVVDEIPVSAAGKVLRRELRTIVEQPDGNGA